MLSSLGPGRRELPVLAHGLRDVADQLRLAVLVAEPQRVALAVLVGRDVLADERELDPVVAGRDQPQHGERLRARRALHHDVARLEADRGRGRRRRRAAVGVSALGSGSSPRRNTNASTAATITTAPPISSAPPSREERAARRLAARARRRRLRGAAVGRGASPFARGSPFGAVGQRRDALAARRLAQRLGHRRRPLVRGRVGQQQLARARGVRARTAGRAASRRSRRRGRAPAGRARAPPARRGRARGSSPRASRASRRARRRSGPGGARAPRRRADRARACRSAVAGIAPRLPAWRDWSSWLWTERSEDEVRARLPVDDRHKQPLGLVHGGVYAVIADALTATAAGRSPIRRASCARSPAARSTPPRAAVTAAGRPRCGRSTSRTTRAVCVRWCA